MFTLTKNEELILLIIWKLKDNAYGVTIRENFKRISGKTLNFGSLYNTLYLLTRKGFVRNKESEPVSKQGGRRKILYTPTLEGKKALQKAQQTYRRAWEDVSELMFENKK